jgi:soluble lytic murein transglycosylase-like protein
VLALVAALVGALALELARPIARAAREVRREVSESSGVERVEGCATLLREAACDAGLDPNLLAGLVFVESRGKVGAVSGADALGLCQLKLETAVERALLLGLDAPTREQLLKDAVLNAQLGAHHLRWLVDRYRGDVERALVAYNAGPGRLERWIKEAGSWARWRDAAESSGRSDAYAYVADVLRWRDFFAERATIVAPCGPPAPLAAPRDEADRGSFVGPIALSSSPGDV